jgi:hypothetical protein
VCGSGAVVCSLFLLIRWAQRARCQAETPLIVSFRFLRPALVLFCASLAMTLMVGACFFRGLRIQSYVVSRYMGWRFVDRRLHQCSHHHQPTSEGLK